MSWVVDVSRCLGLMDVGSRDVGRRGPGPSAPLRRHAKSSTWLLGSPLCRGSSQGTAAKKRLHRSGSRSTPCLSHDTVASPKRKQHSVDVLGRGSLNSTPGNSSVDSLDTEPPNLQPPSSPAPGTSPGRGAALVMTMSYEPRPRSNLARSCEVLGSPEAETSIDSPKQFANETPARARSVTRLDCSVNYSDSPPLVPPTPIGCKDTPRGVFLEARDTLVSRLLGAGSRGPPLPETEHPTRVFRARHRFARSDHCLNHPLPQRRVSHHSVTRTREPPVGGVGARSRSEHALIRPSSSGSSTSEDRASFSDWSIWAQDLLDSLHQMNGHASRRTSSSSCLASTSSTMASRSSTMASASSTVFSHSASASSIRAAMIPRSRGSSGGSIDTQASLADDGSSGQREVNPRAVRRTHSDVGGAGGRGSVHYSRQLSTPQPIKIRPAHRLPQHTASLHRSKSLKRSKGSSHLRRSISQPLDLDKAYDTPVSTLRKCRSPTNTPKRRQRRPSAGNILNEDNTTSEDEIGMSDSEDFRNDLKRSLEEDDDMIIYAEALWDHVTLDCEELVFKAGDLITVIDSSDKDWWWGRIGHRAGWFPAAFVRLLVNQEEHQDTSGRQNTSTLGPARKLSISGLSHDQIRTNVINEIISTERDFVKHLRDVVEGYLRQVRKRPDMFTDERVSTIFGNMEALYHFQSNFLRELEMCIDWQEPFKSCIGATFIRNREKFEIYSEYCNNHPSAVSALQELYQDQKYVHFFEACRLLQEMIDISLDGFLLTPVQKICKYPLQLQELLKYTKPDHPDYTSVQGALEAMRDVALLVNERKRRMECLEKIASWQITVEGWEGPELLEDSSQLIYQGEVTKGVGGSWPKEVTLFLFDHQLVYCKRDLLKRNTFVYRGRLNLDNCEIVDLPDGKDSSLNINVHNGWKIHSYEKNKWYVFSCKTTAEKQKWMEAFKRERELVAEDQSAGFVVADKAKHLAKVAARNQKNRPKRPRTTKSHKRVQAMTYAQAELLVNVDPEVRSNSLPSGIEPPEGKKKGLWFSFGGHKKGRGSGRTLSQIQHHPV